MSDSSSLVAYRRAPPPSLGGDLLYYQRELQKLERTIETLIEVTRKLEARIVVLEP